MRIRFHYATILLVVLMALAVILPGASAQTTPSQKDDELRVSEALRTNTRLVVVDVVVTDSKGQPVRDLKAEDFTLLEAGTPQNISGFSFQHGGETHAITTPQLPSKVISNIPQYKSNTLNVVLFDSVNGEPASQAYAKDQLARFFATATLDSPVAVFALESRLKLLHDFTTDAAVLKSVIDKYSPPTKANITESFDSRRSAFATKGDFHTDDRGIETTLSQLNELAKMLASHPGRKNLIWLSESFPLSLFPESLIPPGVTVADIGGQTADGTGSHGPPLRADPDTFDRMVEVGGEAKNYASLVKKVADAFMNAQVAVYPVDAAGVGRNEHMASQHTMADIASNTGGKVFLNSNNITLSIGSSMDDGATYYTLSYYPDNKKWDGQFRAIAIKINRTDVKLRHRVGYYALDPEKLRKEDADKVAENLSRMLDFDAPAASAILFQAGVVPPSEKTQNKLLVNFAIDPRTISFERTSDGLEHAKIVCTVWAYGKNKDKPNMSDTDATRADLKPDIYEQMMKHYFPCSRTMELKSGTYTLKLAVLDKTTNLIGTTVTTVTVP